MLLQPTALVLQLAAQTQLLHIVLQMMIGYSIKVFKHQTSRVSILDSIQTLVLRQPMLLLKVQLTFITQMRELILTLILALLQNRQQISPKVQIFTTLQQELILTLMQDSLQKRLTTLPKALRIFILQMKESTIVLPIYFLLVKVLILHTMMVLTHLRLLLNLLQQQILVWPTLILINSQ